MQDVIIAGIVILVSLGSCFHGYEIGTTSVRDDIRDYGCEAYLVANPIPPKDK